MATTDYYKGYNQAIKHIVAYLGGFFSISVGLKITQDMVNRLLDEIREYEHK